MYQESVQSRINLATTSASSPSLNNTLFITANTYFKERLRGYNSFDEVKADDAIPTQSNAYKGLQIAFKRTSAVPIFLGRREVSTPQFEVTSSTVGQDITVTVDVVSETDNTSVTSVIKYTILPEDDTTAKVAAKVEALLDAVTNIGAAVSGSTITITPEANYFVVTTTILNMKDVSTSTETAPTLLSAIQDEDNESWYFLTCEDHTQEFVLAMANEIEATESSNYPKQYHTSTQDANSIVPLVTPAIDVLGKLKELNFVRTRAQWHNQADSNFIEVADTAYNGQFQAGVTTWKFMPAIGGVTAASDPVTGKPLSTSKQGYIRDRNASWYGIERGVNFSHGGMQSSGEWTDIIQAKDWLNDTIEVRLLNLLLSQVGGKIQLNSGGKRQVENVINTVLDEAVSLGILTGYLPAQCPETNSFEDQAARILKGVKWTGFLAGAIHFIIVDGILTYSDEEVAA